MNNSHTIIDNDHQCTIVVSEENSHHPKKIIDLKNDCLAKIFGYLNLQSLFNVARANEWLRPAAASVYDRKYGDIKISINSCDNYYEPKCNEHLEKDLDDGLEEALKVDIWRDYVNPRLETISEIFTLFWFINQEIDDELP